MTKTDLPAEPRYRKGALIESVTEFVCLVLGGHPFCDRKGNVWPSIVGRQMSIDRINRMIKIGDVLFHAVPEED